MKWLAKYVLTFGLIAALSGVAPRVDAAAAVEQAVCSTADFSSSTSVNVSVSATGTTNTMIVVLMAWSSSPRDISTITDGGNSYSEVFVSDNGSNDVAAGWKGVSSSSTTQVTITMDATFSNNAAYCVYEISGADINGLVFNFDNDGLSGESANMFSGDVTVGDGAVLLGGEKWISDPETAPSDITWTTDFSDSTPNMSFRHISVSAGTYGYNPTQNASNDYSSGVIGINAANPLKVIEKTVTVTADGVFTVTEPGLGVPKAVLVRGVLSSGSGEGNYTIGASDGDSQWEVSVSIETGQGSVDARSNAETDQCARIYNGAGSTRLAIDCVGDGTGSNPGPITDGWQFVAVAYSANAELQITLFSGEVLANVGTHDSDANSVTLNASSGDGQFTADFVVAANASHNFNGSATNDSDLSIGFTDFTDNVCWVFYDDSGATAADPESLVSSSAIAGVIAGGSVVWRVAYSSPTSTGWTTSVVEGTGSSNQDIGYLALGNVANAKVGIVDTPTSTASAWAPTPLSFTPEWVAFAVNAQTATNSVAVDIGGANGVSVTDFSSSNTGEFTDEDAADPTVTSSFHSTKLLDQIDEDGSTVELDEGTSASISPTSSGWSLTWGSSPTPSGTAEKWPYAALGETVAGGGSDVLPFLPAIILGSASDDI